MKKWLYVPIHALAAAAFIFVMQRFVFNLSLEMSLLWALAFAVMAAGLAISQLKR